jgi:hypothetical protein
LLGDGNNNLRSEAISRLSKTLNSLEKKVVMEEILKLVNLLIDGNNKVRSQALSCLSSNLNTLEKKDAKEVL